jgi:ankyrin repeat protein
VGRVLIAHGADVNAKNVRHVLPMHRAGDMHHSDFVKLLREHGGTDVVRF